MSAHALDEKKEARKNVRVRAISVKQIKAAKKTVRFWCFSYLYVAVSARSSIFFSSLCVCLCLYLFRLSFTFAFIHFIFIDNNPRIQLNLNEKWYWNLIMSFSFHFVILFNLNGAFMELYTYMHEHVRETFQRKWS